MNDISEYNSNGWASIHEASYNGSEEDLNAILDHARELHRNVIDMRTADDMKTTPLLVNIFLKLKSHLFLNIKLKTLDSSIRRTHRHNKITPRQWCRHKCTVNIQKHNSTWSS